MQSASVEVDLTNTGISGPCVLTYPCRVCAQQRVMVESDRDIRNQVWLLRGFCHGEERVLRIPYKVLEETIAYENLGDVLAELILREFQKGFAPKVGREVTAGEFRGMRPPRPPASVPIQFTQREMPRLPEQHVKRRDLSFDEETE